MKLTERDIRLLKDLALSQVLSRDQIISVGYFTSVSRTNRRLKILTEHGYVKYLTTVFHDQRLYILGPLAKDLLGERVKDMISNRSSSPRFLQHSLAVTNVRIALMNRGLSSWRFEQQIRDSVSVGDKLIEIRPDGLVMSTDGPIYVEVDLGNVSLKSFSKKITAFERYANSRMNTQEMRVLVVTTGPLRMSHLKRCVPKGSMNYYTFKTFKDLGVECPGGWS